MRIMPHLNVHLDHSLSNEGGAEESPKGNQEVPAGDSSQVEKGVWNAEKAEDRVKRRERGDLAAAKMPKKPTLSTNCWMPYFARSNLKSNFSSSTILVCAIFPRHSEKGLAI